MPKPPTRILSTLGIAPLILLAAGCSSLKLRPIDPPIEHVLMFDIRGELVDPTGNTRCGESEDGFCHGRQWSLRRQPRLSEEQVVAQREQIFAEMREYARSLPEGARPTLFLFAHGGLNPRASSLKRVKNLATAMEGSGSFPLLINWRSSFRSSYFEHLLYLRQGKRIGLRATVKAPFYLLADVARGVRTGARPVELHRERNLNRALPLRQGAGERAYFHHRRHR